MISDLILPKNRFASTVPVYGTFFKYSLAGKRLSKLSMVRLKLTAELTAQTSSYLDEHIVCI